MSKIKRQILGDHLVEYLTSPFKPKWWTNKWQQFPSNIKRYWVFILVMAILAFLDAASTKAGLSLGFTEKNLHAANLITSHGFNIAMLISSLEKMGLLFISVFLSNRILLHTLVLAVLIVVVLNFSVIALTLSGRLSVY